jgi:hypothetical protein
MVRKAGIVWEVISLLYYQHIANSMDRCLGFFPSLPFDLQNPVNVLRCHIIQACNLAHGLAILLHLNNSGSFFRKEAAIGLILI